MNRAAADDPERLTEEASLSARDGFRLIAKVDFSVY